MQHCAPLQTLLDVLSGRLAAPPVLDAAGWDAFLAEAARHGVSALAAHALRNAEWAPAQIVQKLERYLLRNRMRNMRLYGRLSDLLSVLAAAGIEVIVLKGAHLARAVYEDAALRAMSDVDLLVRERDLALTAEVMHASQWQRSPSLREGGHQLPTFERDGVQIDVHWSIEDNEAPFAIDVAALWQRAVPMTFGHARSLVLAPEDLLLHLCLHTAYGHGWRQFDGGLRQLADIASVIRCYGPCFDWDAFIARALAWRVERCAWLALAAARDLLDAPVPDSVYTRLVPSSSALIGRTQDAIALALGAHYDDLAERVPALSRSSMDKRWRRSSAWCRWREVMLASRTTLSRSYPRLSGSLTLARLAHWKDLSCDAARVILAREDGLLWRREQRRHAMLTWLEGSRN